MSRITTWYIECLDAHTNEALSRLLQNEIPVTNCTSSVLCIDGESRNLWEVKYSTIAQLEKSKTQLNLKFKVFKRDGKHGAVREWNFPKKKKLANSAEGKKAQEFIRQRKK